MTGRIGTDIVSVSRITRLLDDGGTELVERWFTPEEIRYCLAKAVPGRHLAARLAAKEAVAKALSWRWDAELPWRFIEIVLDDHGAPSVRLSGRVAHLAAAAGADSIQVSLSHCDEFATATAIVGPASAHTSPAGSER